ncbi:MAG: hypothetical protein N2746_09380 [Deltaproteobacteria bacterium]|nr:hypothetical protein [Deltaproteobacteria bacterium]
MSKNILKDIIILIAGLGGILLLAYLYRVDKGDSILERRNKYMGKIVGPLNGEVKFLDIISDRRIDCINHGFLIYLSGLDNEDFVIVTESVREAFGDLPENIVGSKFRFEKLIECKKRIDNKRTFLLFSYPVLIDYGE